jgi:hypothetical protein
METGKPIAVYSTSRKNIIISAISAFAYTLLGMSARFSEVIDEEGKLFSLMILIGILIIIQTLNAFYKFTTIEIFTDRVSLKKPFFKKKQTVKFDDFQRLYFFPTGNLRYLVGHYRDKVRKMLMAEFNVNYELFENYEEMVLKLWTMIPCKKLIKNKPAEENDIYDALKADKLGSNSLITRLTQNF